MSNDLLSLLLDVVVLVFLGATIFYVTRLFKSLNDFKAHRREFDGVITSLLSSIDQAERSVNALKQVSAQEAGELEHLIQQSKAMSEELKIINEAGENMAKRLEDLAEKNRKISQSSHRLSPQRSSVATPSNEGRAFAKKEIISPVHSVGSSMEHVKKDEYGSTLRTVEKMENDPDLPSFMIQDREYKDPDDSDACLDVQANNDTLTDVVSEKLQSQAERDLLSALRHSKRNSSKRGRP